MLVSSPAQANREAGGQSVRPPTRPPNKGCRVERRACSRHRGAAEPSRSAVLFVWGRFHDQRSDTPIATTDARINERIRAREVRLVGPDGDQIGVKPLPEALHIAREHDLDLVEVAPNANPPVCKIMDFGKFKYEQDVRRKESRRKATNVVIKEMKF
ncbi:MAG: translation initiation factor IF-3, partial [Acidimicrobiia bacterium]